MLAHLVHRIRKISTSVQQMRPLVHDMMHLPAGRGRRQNLRPFRLTVQGYPTRREHRRQGCQHMTLSHTALAERGASHSSATAYQLWCLQSRAKQHQACQQGRSGELDQAAFLTLDRGRRTLVVQTKVDLRNEDMEADSHTRFESAK